MTEKITFQDMLLFAFNETALGDTVRVSLAMEADPLVQAEYDELWQTIGLIQTASLSPSQSSIERIMSFAKG